MSRDFDFPIAVKRIIAQRVNYICSNPECRCFTAGPNIKDKTDTKIADCAHIYSGASDGPRYNLTIDENFLKSAKNALWLCKNCHRRIDRNWEKYPTDLLLQWKEETEKLVENYIESNTSPIKLLNDVQKYFINHGKDLPDNDMNILLAFFKEDFNPGSIMSERDINLKYYLYFSKFDNKLTIPNRFKYYDLLAQIYLNLNKMDRVKDFLVKSIETDYDDPKKVFNEGFLAYIMQKKSEALTVCKRLEDYPEHYFLLKLFLVDNVDELNEFVDEINIAKYSHVNVYLNIAHKACDKGEYSTARIYALKAIELDNKTSNICFVNASIILDCVIHNPMFDDLHLTLSDIKDLKLSLSIINETINRNNFVDADLQQVYWNLSIIHFLLGDFDLSLGMIEKINDQGLLNQSRFLKARVYHRMHKNNDALIEIDKLLTNDKKNLNYLSLKGYIYIELEEFNEALKCFELGKSYSSKERLKGFVYGIAEALHFSKSPSESSDYLIKQFENEKDITYLIRNLSLNFKDEDIENIIKYYNKFIYEEVDTLSDFHRNMLGEYFFRFNQFEIAVDLFQKSYNKNMSLIFSEKYIKSLIAIDNRVDALKISKEIREDKNCNDLIPLEASILDQLGKTDEAETLTHKYYEVEKNDYSALVYSFYLIKNSKLESASEILKRISGYLDLSTYNFSIYYNCLLEINESQNAFDCLYNYLQRHEESEEACNMFIILFLRISNIDEIRDFLTSFEKEIRLDSGVTIINDDNRILTVLIEKKTNHLKDEYSIDSSWGKILIGKQKGDSFTKSDGFIDNEYRIVDVCHKSVTKWNKLIADSTKFANPVITTIKIDLKATDIETMLGKAANLIKDGAKDLDNVHDIYKSNKLTLGIVANIANKNLLNTIQYYIFNPTIEFLASSGNVQEINEATLILRNTSSIIIDLTSIILINYLNIWDKLSTSFTEIYVAQSSIDEIDKSFNEEDTQLGESPGSIGLIGKQIGLIPRSQEQRESWKDYLNTLKEKVLQNCIIIQESEDLNLFSYKQKLVGLNLKIRENIGKCFIDSIAIALFKKSAFFSDDYMLRKVSNHFSINNFWLQPFLGYLLEKNEINFEEYYDFILRLLQINYKFIHLNIPILLHSINKSKYEVDINTNLFLDNLFKSDIPSLVNVGGGFLYGAIKSIPILLNPTALIMSFFSKYYEKTKSVGHLIAFIDSIYIATSDAHVVTLLKKKLVEWKLIYGIK